MPREMKAHAGSQYNIPTKLLGIDVVLVETTGQPGVSCTSCCFGIYLQPGVCAKNNLHRRCYESRDE